MAIPFALQLYTVRDHLEKDFLATLKQVKAIGYDFVETAGFGGNTAAEAHALMESAGLSPVSAHVGYPDATRHPETVIDTARALGVSYVATGIFFEGGGTREDWVSAGKALDAAGAQLRQAGIQLCYHNHAHEFVQFGGEYAYDLMMAAAKPANLQAQIDTYWVKDAGLDPVAVIRQYAGRCPLLHIKDMSAGTPHTFAEVGAGIIDWPPVFEAGKAADAAAPAADPSSVLAPVQTLDGYGTLKNPPPTAQALPAAKLAETRPSADHPPGYYGAQSSPRALNVIAPKTVLKPLPTLPASAERRAYTSQTAKPLKPAFWTPDGTHSGRMILHEGRFHQIRRMFEALGNEVVGLDRYQTGGLPIGELATGAYRVLDEADLRAIEGEHVREVNARGPFD